MERQWYYRKTPQERHGPIPEASLRATIARGDLEGRHEVWTEGMDDWRPIDAVPELTAAGPSSQAAALPAAATTAPARAVLPPGLLGWMSFVAIMTIISGALSILSCFGIPTGVLMVIAGVGLYGAKTALETQASVDRSLSPFFEKLKLFVMLQGIVYLLGILIGGLLVVFYFSIIAAAVSSGNWNF